MTNAVGKSDLLRRLRAGYTRFHMLIARLTMAELEDSGAAGVWSLKDLIAHFIAHEQFALNELAAAQRGKRYQHPISDNQAMNADAVAQYAATPAEQVLLAWDRSFHQVVAAIEALAEADFASESTLVSTLGDTIDGAFANNTYEHYAEHTPAVRAWLDQR